MNPGSASGALVRRSPSPPVAPLQERVPPWGLPEWFLICQTALPALLFLPGTQGMRLPIRVTAYAISLVALIRWSCTPLREPTPSPARPWLGAALVYLGLMITHPTTNTMLAGVAQVMLYLSVLAPIFWLPGLVSGLPHLQRLLAILLVCNGVNAIVGVLQVYDPGHWMPQEFSRLVMEGPYGLDAVSYSGPDGQRIIRPPGLFDSPGAVSGPGMFAGLLGLIFCLRSHAGWKKVLAAGFAFAGIAVIYLTQVRTCFLVLLGMILVCGSMLTFHKQWAKATAFLSLAGFLGVAALVYAALLGGQSIVERFETLFEDDPITVYYETKRGGELEFALTRLLGTYPLGAGLGRWGMMRRYFGDPANLESPLIWAELQITGWILDGGIVLLTLYSVALGMTFINGIHLSRRTTDPEFRFWGTAILAMNAGILALTFGFSPFTTQIGLQYWFLVAAHYGAAHRQQEWQ